MLILLICAFCPLLTSCRANMESDQQQPYPRTRARDAKRLHAAANRSAKAKAQRMADQKLKAVFDNRPFLDRQAALNLAQFSQSNSDLHLGSSEVEDLIGTLIVIIPKLPTFFINTNDHLRPRLHLTLLLSSLTMVSKARKFLDRPALLRHHSQFSRMRRRGP